MNRPIRERSAVPCDGAAKDAAADPTVGTIGAANFVTLPGWFSVRQARAVLRLKRKRFAVLLGGPGLVQAVTAATVAEAPVDDLLVSCATRLGPPLTPDVPLDEALFHLDKHACPLVPLMVDGVLVGIVDRDEVRELRARLPASRKGPARRLAA